MTPRARQSSAESTPTPSLRSRQIGLSSRIVSYSSMRAGISSRNRRIFGSPSSGRSMMTPPMRMYAGFMRSPVSVSKMSIRISRSRKP